MKRLPVVMFDLGGVLVENVTVVAVNALLPEPLDDEVLRHRWLTSESVRAFELGRTDPDAFASRFVREWGLDLSPSGLLAEFATWPRAFLPGAEDLVATLRADHHVACFSNCNEIHWARFDGFTEHFDSVFSSHLLGCIKPDAEIFETILHELAERSLPSSRSTTKSCRIGRWGRSERSSCTAPIHTCPAAECPKRLTPRAEEQAY